MSAPDEHELGKNRVPPDDSYSFILRSVQQEEALHRICLVLLYINLKTQHITNVGLNQGS
ncbi:unnamed protein product [Spirodela intermedia]|uniref:Uncharacterized protein n=1 Tax=Spirodela intermedia TaxID=51605 RepID=A0A7I8K4R0_SPIIN|nr:unnamed protein product [Spirodela intermedia]